MDGSVEEVGVRLEYCVKDAVKLKSEYLSAFPRLENGGQQKSLSHFLSLQGNLSRHFAISYFALENTEGGTIALPRDPEEGKRVLCSLIRVDFVDAQRNFDDHEIGRSKRLSTAFAAFYKKNLEQAEVREEANQVIDENNETLNKHYNVSFQDLMEVIKGLGVPSVNDRQMRIVSTLSPEVALQGNTDLLYVDDALNHELPEAYNGLGFKNLVYMAIQISHFHLQWMRTEEKRPLCQIIFIEEPEVHLHAQVQQTFISNIWSIIQKASKDAKEEHMVPQLGITTHSSHIIDAVEFEKVRYFRRCALDGEDLATITTLNASKVLSLREFKPQKASTAGETEDEKETLDFLKRYLKLTHCDLFFADAAVLVEGTVEKLLLPKMIEKSASGLKRNYLTVLEVGGAYAHRFASLLEFLDISYLVITDLDSVDPNDERKVCRADKVGAFTSNASLKFFLNESKISDLAVLEPEKQILADDKCFVAFQKPTSVAGHDPEQPMHGRTFEETFTYHNMQLFRDKNIVGITIPDGKDFEREYEAVFKRVKSSSFKKTAFALDVASSEVDWVTPLYIAKGLCWLENKLSTKTEGEAV
jgi:putative ATP-dependent endonuclease of the OLD family